MYCLLNVLYCVLIRGLGKIGYTKRATLLKKLLTYSLVLQDTVIDETGDEPDLRHIQRYERPWGPGER